MELAGRPPPGHDRRKVSRPAGRDVVVSFPVLPLLLLQRAAFAHHRQKFRARRSPARSLSRALCPLRPCPSLARPLVPVSGWRVRLPRTRRRLRDGVSAHGVSAPLRMGGSSRATQRALCPCCATNTLHSPPTYHHHPSPCILPHRHGQSAVEKLYVVIKTSVVTDHTSTPRSQVRTNPGPA